MDELPAQQIPGLTPWCCEYWRDGKRYGITLYGADPKQVVEDNCAELPALTVLGELICEIPCDDTKEQSGG